jgi:hypothetical protein
MELANQKALVHGRDDLAAISKTGEVCSKVLDPVDTAIAAIAAMARKLESLLGPIKDVLAAIEGFVRDMEKFIDDFTKALRKSTAAQCALEIFEPVTDFVNLVTCPVDEAVDEAFRAVIGTMVDKVSDLINKATTKLITKGVEALVPDDLRIEIPDFRPNLPTGTWLATCATAAAFPEHDAIQATFSAVQLLYGMKLPHTVTGEQIEQQILDEVLARTQIEPLRNTGYTSACVEAFKELGTDYKACSKASYVRVGKALKLRGCEKHYEDFPLTCTRCKTPWDCHTYTKKSYCSSGLEEVDLRCYKKCKSGYHGVGPVCWINR